MINKEMGVRWVEALRSGKYKQGRYRLRKDGRYCCLGVLADLINPAGWNGAIKTDAEVWIDSTGTECIASVPEDTLPPCQSKLTRMNDFQGNSFREIADYIEENILPLL